MSEPRNEVFDRENPTPFNFKELSDKYNQFPEFVSSYGSPVAEAATEFGFKLGKTRDVLNDFMNLLDYEAEAPTTFILKSCLHIVERIKYEQANGKNHLDTLSPFLEVLLPRLLSHPFGKNELNADVAFERHTVTSLIENIKDLYNYSGRSNVIALNMLLAYVHAQNTTLITDRILSGNESPEHNILSVLKAFLYRKSLDPYANPSLDIKLLSSIENKPNELELLQSIINEVINHFQIYGFTKQIELFYRKGQLISVDEIFPIIDKISSTINLGDEYRQRINNLSKSIKSKSPIYKNKVNEWSHYEKAFLLDIFRGPHFEDMSNEDLQGALRNKLFEKFDNDPCIFYIYRAANGNILELTEKLALHFLEEGRFDDGIQALDFFMTYSADTKQDKNFDSKIPDLIEKYIYKLIESESPMLSFDSFEHVLFFAHFLNQDRLFLLLNTFSYLSNKSLIIENNFIIKLAEFMSANKPSLSTTYLYNGLSDMPPRARKVFLAKVKEYPNKLRRERSKYELIHDEVELILQNQLKLDIEPQLRIQIEGLIKRM